MLAIYGCYVLLLHTIIHIFQELQKTERNHNERTFNMKIHLIVTHSL